MPESKPSVDTANWSGEGEFTQALIDHLQTLARLRFLRVEDAPASRSEADYNFISNEIFVSFATSRARRAAETLRVSCRPPAPSHEKAMTMAQLEAALSTTAAIGRARLLAMTACCSTCGPQRIVPPYQTRGYKLVELVRVYEAGRRDLRPRQ